MISNKYFNDRRAYSVDVPHPLTGAQLLDIKVCFLFFFNFAIISGYLIVNSFSNRLWHFETIEGFLLVLLTYVCIGKG